MGQRRLRGFKVAKVEGDWVPVSWAHRRETRLREWLSQELGRDPGLQVHRTEEEKDDRGKILPSLALCAHRGSSMRASARSHCLEGEGGPGLMRVGKARGGHWAEDKAKAAVNSTPPQLQDPVARIQKHCLHGIPTMRDHASPTASSHGPYSSANVLDTGNDAAWPCLTVP